VKLVGRIPVEPLDDERLTNIERRIVTGASDAAAMRPLHASRLPMVLGFAIAAVVVLCAGVAGWRLRGAGDPAAVAQDVPLHIQTADQRSTLDLGDARIESTPATEYTVTRPGGDGVLVAMARGKVELEVGKRGKRAPLVVRAGDTDVIVVGTHFTVDYGDGTGDVDVRVTEGVVRVVRHHQETRVAAGQTWKTQRGLVASAEPATPGANAGPGATIGDRDRTGSAAVEIDMTRPPDVLHDRIARIPDARLPGPGSGATGSNPRQVTPGPDSVRPRRLDSASDPQLDLKTLIRAQPVLPAHDVGEPDPAKAISIYRNTAAFQKGDEASLAIYSMAVVQAQKLGRTGDAEQTLELYVRRFKGGNEYLAALWLRVRITCLRGFDNVCRQAAYTYLHEAGDSPTGHIAERITMSR
jgi:hypothetical protein